MADFNFDLEGVCSAILRQAKDLAGKNYAMTLQKSLGALDYITSPANGGIKYEITTSGTKVVEAKVLYKQRSLPCEIQDGADAKDATVCDTAVEASEKSVTVRIDDRVATSPRKFTASNMAQICQDTPAFMKEYLDSDKRALREKVNQKILAKLVVDIGVNKRQDGTTTSADAYSTEQLLGTSNSQNIPLTGNFNDVLMDYQNNQFVGIPALIGQGNLQTYFNLAGLACCNATTPFGDALSKSGSAFFLDQTANSVLGTAASETRALMVAFGASHLLWYNENANINIQAGNAAHIVIPDDVYPGLKWDLDFKWDECDKVWIYQQSAYFDVFNVFRSDSFKQNDPSPACDDELYGVTGIWGYKFTNA